MGFRIPRPETAFSLDPSGKETKRKKDPKHLAFVRKLPCVVCGSMKEIEAAHIRMPSLAFGKSSTGMGQKPSDTWVVPLCSYHHRTAPDAQHNGSEDGFWKRHSIDPFLLATRLFECSGDLEKGREVVTQARMGTLR